MSVVSIDASLVRRRRARSRGRRPRSARLPPACVASSASTAGARLAAGLDQEPVAPCSITSVSAMSYPNVARGPVSIETQKHVPPAWWQLSATTKTRSRRAA